MVRVTGHGFPAAAVPDAGAFLARVVRLDRAAVVRLRPAGPAGTALWALLPWDVLATRVVPGGPGVDVTVAATDLLRALAERDPQLPARRDMQWRSSLPPDGARLVETLPESEVRRVAAAAASTVRAAMREGIGGRPVGERVLRDRVLDHVAIRARSATGSADVAVRLVQGLVRMGFLPPGEPATTRSGEGGGGEASPPGAGPAPAVGVPVAGCDGPAPSGATGAGSDGPAPSGATGAGGVVSVLTAAGWVGLAGRYGAVWRYQRTLLDVHPRSLPPHA